MCRALLVLPKPDACPSTPSEETGELSRNRALKRLPFLPRTCRFGAGQGTFYSDEQLQSMLEWCLKRHVHMISDEVRDTQQWPEHWAAGSACAPW